VILLDAGPIVALIHRDDRNHARCRDVLRSIREPLGTAWPVLTEAVYLLGFSWEAQDAAWDMVLTGGVELLPLGARDAPRMRDLMWKYRDLPMDLADAALVALAEREGLRHVFTLDRRDFTLYRPARIGRFAIIP
jgi:predicted nucleic acid-binding protein